MYQHAVLWVLLQFKHYLEYKQLGTYMYNRNSPRTSDVSVLLLVWCTNRLVCGIFYSYTTLGLVAQSVTCLTTDTFLTADPGVASSIPARSHTFTEIDHAILSTVIILPSADSRRVVFSYKRKYMHEVLDNRLVKLAQEQSVLRWAYCPDMTIAVDWDVMNQTVTVWIN